MKYIIGNLKMHILTPADRERYFALFKREMVGVKFNNSKIVLCSPFVHLESFAQNFSSKYIEIGAQDVFWEKSGSFTGAVSPYMIKGIGAKYVIIGHSERRDVFGESSEIENCKIKAALKAGLTVLYCVGESKEQRDNDLTQDIVSVQLEDGLRDITPVHLDKIIIAYEPIWSVGTDIIPTSNEIMEVKILIHKMLHEKYGAKKSQKIPIIYGGSVSDKTAKQLCLDPGMDGALIGRESLNPHDFVKIAQIIDSN